MCYVILRRRWCGIVLNVHASRKHNIEDMKDSFYEEVECMYILQFP
jgi:hypothetical protein